MESVEHVILKQVALRWLQKTGCVAFVCEVSYAHIGIVDVMGLKQCGDVYVVEAKVSRSDFRNDFKPHGFNQLSKIARFEVNREIDFVYYIIADDIDTADLPTSIGILSESGAIKRRAKRQNVVHTEKTRLDAFIKIAKSLSWRKYGYVINHEAEQLEFSLQ